MNGRIIHGRFEILGEIGHGGMGVVYRARQISLDRIVALKMLSANLVDDEEFRERFLQEAKIIARLTHPNIVQVYDIIPGIEGEESGFCIVMEYLDGRSLRELLREAKALRVERAVAIAEQVADGLAYAHAKGIIHRDIKPDNIMMLGDEQVKLMDFGIARLRGSSIDTQTGVCMGTPLFMSPEQARSKPVDARSDLYSLAVVLYSMVTGELPFVGDSPVTIALKHLREQPRRPSEVSSAVPPALDSIILKGMAKRPSERYQSAEELRQALGRLGTAADVAVSADSDETYVSPPVTPQPAVGRVGSEPWDTPAEAAVMAAPRRRRFGWAWLATAVPGLIALAIVLFVIFERPAWRPWRRGPLGPPGRERITPPRPGLIGRQVLESATFGELLPRLRALQANRPEPFGNFVRGNEEILREKAAAEIGQMVLAGELDEARQLREAAREVIFPYLTEERQNVWRKDLGGPGTVKAGPPWRRTPRAHPGLNQLLDDLSVGKLDTSVKRDPARAKRAFAEAQKTAGELESASDREAPSNLLWRCLNAFVESINYDPENWHYRREFAQFLAGMASQEDQPPRRNAILRQALEQIQRARKLCPDRGERKKMQTLEDSILKRLGPPPGKAAPVRRPPPPQ